MTYPTIMVHMDVGSPNDGVLRVTAGLAERFKAKQVLANLLTLERLSHARLLRVVGIAASQPMPIIYCEGHVPAESIQADIVGLAKATSEAEARFRSALHGRCVGLAWRSATVTMSLADYVVREGRAADLLVTGPDAGFSSLNSSRCVVVSDLVMHAGRPVLIVPPATDELDLASVVVAWKETREARRAIADALPLLKLAGRVSLVEVVEGGEVPAARSRLADVSDWLGCHGVTSDAIALPSTGDDAAQLRDVAWQHRASVMVTGAYGHGRLREWAFGGVTRDLLARPDRCSLVSH